MAAMLLTVTLSGASLAQDVGYFEASTRGGMLKLQATHTIGLKLQNVAGDPALDLLVVRDPTRPSNQAQFNGVTVWRSQPLGNAEILVSDTRYPLMIDAQGLYVPGGTPGASRDLAVLAEGVLPGENNLAILRNSGPGARPQFSPLVALSVPDARRLHHVDSFTEPPGTPGFTAYPLIATTADDRLWVVEVGEDGWVEVQPGPLRHPGGVGDVLVYREPGTTTPMLISTGAAPALLWRRDVQGTYQSTPLDLLGLPNDARVVSAQMADFQLDGAPDLVLALEDGQVLRWDGIPGTLDGFGPAQDVAMGLSVHDMAAVGVACAPGDPFPCRPGILIAAEPESRFYDTDPSVAGHPFVDTPQKLAAARAVAGDFGLLFAHLGLVEGGVLSLAFTANPSESEVPNPVGWAELDPLPALVVDNQPVVFVELSAARPLSSGLFGEPYRPVGIAIRNANGSCPDAALDAVRVPAGARTYGDYLKVQLSQTTLESGPGLICLTQAQVPGALTAAPLLREPRVRQVYRVPSVCGASFAGCLAATAPPAKGTAATARKSFVDIAGLNVLPRFRDQILARTTKGRDYIALYRELANEAYVAVAIVPFALRELAQARNLWLPAIEAWVDGDTSTTINAEMVDSFNQVAEYLVTLGNERLSNLIRFELQQLQIDSLVGQPISALEQRFEALPTRRIIRSGFEAGEGIE